MPVYRTCGRCGGTHAVGRACPTAPTGRAAGSPSTRAQRDGTGDYDRNRRIILFNRPPCHWCGRPDADTADHVVSVSRGGSNRLENLVPACAPCNKSRKDNPNWRPTR